MIQGLFCPYICLLGRCSNVPLPVPKTDVPLSLLHTWQWPDSYLSQDELKLLAAREAVIAASGMEDDQQGCRGTSRVLIATYVNGRTLLVWSSAQGALCFLSPPQMYPLVATCCYHAGNICPPLSSGPTGWGLWNCLCAAKPRPSNGKGLRLPQGCGRIIVLACSHRLPA